MYKQTTVWCKLHHCTSKCCDWQLGTNILFSQSFSLSRAGRSNVPLQLLYSPFLQPSAQYDTMLYNSFSTEPKIDCCCCCCCARARSRALLPVQVEGGKVCRSPEDPSPPCASERAIVGRSTSYLERSGCTLCSKWLLLFRRCSADCSGVRVPTHLFIRVASLISFAGGGELIIKNLVIRSGEKKNYYYS
ncbi:hypothetical protein MPTK2_8g04600 [Marchantia polymorpha subsp. ruderalis]